MSRVKIIIIILIIIIIIRIIIILNSNGFKLAQAAQTWLGYDFSNYQSKYALCNANTSMVPYILYVIYTVSMLHMIIKTCYRKTIGYSSI